MLIECGLGVYAVRSKTRGKTFRLPYSPFRVLAYDPLGVPVAPRGDRMSGSDVGDGQCNRTSESNVAAMGDVLAKKHADDAPHDGCTDADGDPTRQDVDPVDDYGDDAVRSPVVADAVPVANMTLDESTINAFIKGARDPEIIEHSPLRTSLETVVDNSSSSLSIDSPSRGKEACSCDTFKAKRELFREELQKAMKFQNLWTELRQHIRTSFNAALEATRTSGSLQLQQSVLSVDNMHDIVLQLCKRDPRQLFMRLVSQAQEFVVEVKVRLLALLHDRSVNNLAEIFLTGLLDDYDALISTASQISELVKPLKDHLCKFNLSWDCFIKKLYQIYVYDDPLVQNNLPPFIGQLRKLLPLKGSEYQGLVHRYLSFDDEMTVIGDLWPETEPWMDKYNAEQAVRMTRLRQIREAWELFTATRKLMEQRMLNKSPDSGNELQEVDGQLSTLASQAKVGICEMDSRPLSPTPDFSLDSLNMPPSIEIVQILLDDWNKAQHQKLADIAGVLTATDIYANGQDDPDFFDYARATCHLAQFAIRSVRAHNEGGCLENNAEEGKSCDCHMCIGPAVSPTVNKSDTDNIELPLENPFPQLTNGFLEDTANCSATQVKKKVEEVETVEAESDGKEVKNVQEDTDLRTSEPQPCSCVYQHAREITERKREVLENPPCPCLLNSKRKWDTCPCLAKSVPDMVGLNNHPKPVSPSAVKTNQESNKPAVKTGSTQSAQTQTRHSTTQTQNTTHNHATHQGTAHPPHTHGLLPDLVKNTGTPHRPHAHTNHSSHACHKQANVEHIKRVSCNDLSSGDGDCSDSGSSQEDSCSTSSSAQRDSSRHCDCCYCEVFGHGVASVAPVSRNYNEMRERLRQLLTKKQAKKCKAACSPSKSSSESLSTNPNTETKAITNSAPRSNTPVSTTSTVQPDQRDQRDLEELLEFIEGNQNGKKDNNKKAEKKARQKQRKLEEKLKRDRQEAERQKLIELQKKTPEVTITVVDPQKPVPQRLLPRCNLPEVSILPTSPPVALPTVKQLSNKKKDKQEVYSNSSNTSSSSCSSSSSSTSSSINSKTKTAPVNTNLKNKSINISKLEKTAVSSQTNKTVAKNDKVDVGNKTNKTQTSNSASGKQNTSNTAEKSLPVDSTDKKLTKKERKKLKKLEETKAKEVKKPVQAETQPQIVTIKRVMESNSTEPTVTITLKGQTPAEDKVLFTLVNGQTKEVALPKMENEQNQNISGKKKKTKANNNNNNNTNNNNSLQQGNKLQQTNNSKQQSQNKICDNKNAKQQTNNDKPKGKQVDEKKLQQQSITETKTKSKKDKKNTENKENVLQQNTVNKNKNQQQSVSSKKQTKINTPPQTPVSQKTQNTTNENQKKSKGQQQDKNGQLNSAKNNKSMSANTASKQTKSDNQKTQSKTPGQMTIKQRPEVQPASTERVNSPLSSQFKDISANSKINIENLKLPPGITITKVDAPAKPLPIRSAPLPKPVNPPKQTTIIAAPMSGVQSSYASPQAGGNVIVVDTGKLKQDLLPKPAEKDVPKETPQTQSTTSKKKKKKNKNAPNSGNTINQTMAQNSDPFANDHIDEPARILHNPNTNTVTIRNPAFGPMKVPPTQQAAIIKVSENGMVTIRSPALQQAINAGLTSPPKPDYIVKGDLSSRPPTENANLKHVNGIIPSSLAELRSRLNPDCATLNGLANIQISKVTNGQPIPENGINLKGTSVTLTKVRTDTSIKDVQSAKTTGREAINTSLPATTTGKSKKKKKRGAGARQCGDDWNLVESVFTPKDIDLEDGEMDDVERELEAFKRFCLQSVPPPRKEKVNLNIKDIVLKKKSSSSSSSSSAAAAVIAAN
ncbi:uncharacterized protein LOC128875001 isoform X1 [Hylaeus volcanicus]|uniref:uncharacterized protein LOC128875001 isoform X1 n=1 Tax=Hylaeus volcanicus TaxID=313075 RepID=UPI0023B87DA6|nr:uncharacterized protein LOC128875001 isoform X1 [Hylaeus volcanicus]